MATADATGPNQIAALRVRLQSLRQSVESIDELLTGYIETEQQLHESQERFQLLIDGVRDYAIFMLDPSGHIVSWNAGAQRIKGYSSAEAIGLHFSIFYPPEDMRAAKPEHELTIATRDGRYEEEGWRVRKDGSLFWANVVITALYDARGELRGFGKVTRDLTERRWAQEAQYQLREQEQQLIREQEARKYAEATLRSHDEFLTATAHELRTPITSLLGYTQLLQRRFEQGRVAPEREQRVVQAILEQVQRLNRLTSGLLDLTRLDRGQLVLNRAPLDLAAELERIVDRFQILADRHTLALSRPAGPVLILGDELSFEQIVDNLLQNAIKYSPAGSTVAVHLSASATHASVSVADEGIGIPAESLPQVFDRFYRAANISHQHISGIGIGLYIVKELVALHGGTIDVRTTIGSGSVFTVSLPLLGG